MIAKDNSHPLIGLSWPDMCMGDISPIDLSEDLLNCKVKQPKTEKLDGVKSKPWALKI